MKYAIVTINHKGEERRRVLIEYNHTYYEKDEKSKHFGMNIYKGVRVVAKDPYFIDEEEHSYKYEFDHGDSMIAITEINGQHIEIYKPFYSIPDLPGEKFLPFIESQKALYKPIEFECNSDEDAILRFELDK